jgi:hypothetical protein
MINNSIVRIVYKDEKQQDKFYTLLTKINKISIKRPTYMGIDFEFNTKKVALMQILFEVHKKSTIVKKYYIIYPPNLNQKTNDYLKYHIMANKNILKILHGSESLDIPYLVDDFFNMEIEPSIDFFLSMVDTRYMCEYLNILNSRRNPCKIYDLLLDLNIIDVRGKKALELNEEKMGAIYDIIIDINSLTPELITYAIHDVVYLIDAYIHLQKIIIKTNPKDYYLLIDCLRYCFMEKRNITNIGDDLIIINMMNNYFYFINKANNKTKQTLDKILQSTKIDTTNQSDKTEYFYRVSMIKTYDIIIKDYIDSYPNIKFIININYIKTNILNLLRTVVYVIILKNYKVKASNVQTVEYKIDQNYKQIIDSLQILEINYLLELVKHFYDYVLIKLKP